MNEYAIMVSNHIDSLLEPSVVPGARD